jgi:hypothetical protein
MRSPRRTFAAAVAGGLLCAACSSGGSDPGEGAPSDGGVPWPFISQVSDFTGFCKWSSAPATALGDAGDGVHSPDAGPGRGPLTVYWNKSPPPGSHEFPVGTIILKESNEADPTQRLVFAMAKRQPRGTGFNSASAGGADGWEWWSLTDLGNCSVARLWRGTAPPITEPYAGTTVGDCNGCHSQIVSNDYVWDTALNLAHF